jgi:outer membrane protein insertion porin family/translocation and assembly module TamA
LQRRSVALTDARTTTGRSCDVAPRWRERATPRAARRSTPALLLTLPTLLVAGAGCASIPEGRYAVDEVRLEGVESVSEDEVRTAMATRENERFLGVAEGVIVDYEIFDQYALQADMARIQRYYLSRGFYDAQIRAAEVAVESDDEVSIGVEIEEGEPVLVGSVWLEGIDAVPDETRALAEKVVAEELPPDEPFEEVGYIAIEERIKRLLTDAGYAFATVERRVTVDLVKKRADAAYAIAPGRPARFGPVAIEGEGDLPEEKIREALGLVSGAPYSTRTMEEAQADAFELGVFAAVTITPDLSRPATGVVPVRVEVTPAQLHTVRLGGGVTIDTLKSDVHGVVGWEGRNFLGGMRRLTVEAQPALVFVPTRIGDFTAPDHILPALRLRTELRQPGFLEAKTQGFVRNRLEASPILLKEDVNEDDPIVGYGEDVFSVGARRPFGRRFSVELSQNVQYALPFPYVGDLDPSLSDVLLLYPELITTLDFRDDKVHPTKGFLLGHTLQTAFGIDGRDVRTQPEARGYVPLGERVVLAARAEVGLLFPFGYGDDVASSVRRPFEGPDRGERVHDLQVLYFRGFFSGGSNSNRGYPYAGVGPHAVVPYLNPERGTCDRGAAGFDRDRCLSPIGGLSLWEASLEARIDVMDPFSLAVFCDASDVSPYQVDLRLQRPHVSCGPGARVETPVGPIRLDVGYRLPGLQNLEGEADPLEKDPGDLFGVPIAVSFGIGEAF